MVINKNNPTKIVYIDYAIFFFTILFLGSLTNSIFVNQLGYYGALVLLLIRYSITKENLFEKNGLELPLLFFIIVEIVSATLSDNQSQAFNNVLKRVLLLPIIYFVIAAARDKDNAKTFVKVYLLFAVLSAGIYLYNSYQYFVEGLLQATGSGPSLFQYPITTSELLSFTVVYLFAFLIQEKSNWKTKLIILVGLAISGLALIATYKRTGWLGVAAGIAIILIVKRKYIYLAPAVIGLLFLLLTSKDVSKVFIYEYSDNNLSELTSFNTEGRPYDIYSEDSIYVISDYENGLLIHNSKNERINKSTPNPVKDFNKWNDSVYIARLEDTRIQLLFRKDNFELNLFDEILPPGYTKKSIPKNDLLYVLDTDSGLTVYNNPKNVKNFIRYPSLKNNVWIDVSKNRLASISNRGELNIYKLNNSLPIIESKKLIETIGSITSAKFYNDNLVLSDDEGLKRIGKEDNIKMLYKNEKFVKIDVDSNLIVAASIKGDLYIFNHSGVELGKLNIGYQTFSLALKNNKIYTSEIVRNRLTSIFDPYLPSNSVRISLWKAGWEIFKDNPFFGVGDIDLANLYKQYKSKYDKEIQGHLHNNYIHILAILGGFGFIVIAWLLIKIFITNLKIFNKLKNIEFSGSFALGTIGAFVSFLVAGLSEWNFGDHEIITMVWFTIGLNFAFYFVHKNPTNN